MNKETEELIESRAICRSIGMSSSKSGESEQTAAEDSIDDEVAEIFRQEFRQLNWGGINQNIQFIYQYHEPETV